MSERSPVIPFALGGFLVWLFMRRDCAPCGTSGTNSGSSGTGTGTGAGTGTGSTTTTAPRVVPLYMGQTLGFNYPDPRQEKYFATNGVPVPGSKQYVAEVSFDSGRIVTKVVGPPSAASIVRVGDKALLMSLKSGAWV